MKDCACIYSDGAEYGPSFCATSTPVARKPRACCECLRTIAKGERYLRESGKWDSGMNTYTTCSECHEIRTAFCCDGYIYEQLWEDMREQIFPTLKIGCINSLATAAAKQKVMDAWREWQEERV